MSSDISHVQQIGNIPLTNQQPPRTSMSGELPPSRLNDAQPHQLQDQRPMGIQSVMPKQNRSIRQTTHWDLEEVDVVLVLEDVSSVCWQGWVLVWVPFPDARSCGYDMLMPGIVVLWTLLGGSQRRISLRCVVWIQEEERIYPVSSWSTPIAMVILRCILMEFEVYPKRMERMEGRSMFKSWPNLG